MKLGLVVAVLGDAHVAGGDAGDRVILEQHLGGGKAGIDFDAERFRLLRQVAADIAERDDESAVIAHQRRHQRIRHPHRAGKPEHIKAVRRDRGAHRRLLVPPFREEKIEPDRIDHRAGENMRADLGTLLHHDDGGFGRELLEPDRGGKAGRPGADDDNVELHRLASGKVRCIHG